MRHADRRFNMRKYLFIISELIGFRSSENFLPEFTVLRFVTVEISLVDLVDAATETIGGELGSRRSGD